MIDDFFILDLLNSPNNKSINLITYWPDTKSIDEKNILLDSIICNSKKEFIEKIFIFSNGNKVSELNKKLRNINKVSVIYSPKNKFNSRCLSFILGKYKIKNSILSIIEPFTEVSNKFEKIKTLNLKSKFFISRDSRGISSLTFHSTLINSIKSICKEEVCLNFLFKYITKYKKRVRNIKNLSFFKDNTHDSYLFNSCLVKNIDPINYIFLKKNLYKKYINNNNFCICFLISQKDIDKKTCFGSIYNCLNNISSAYKVNLFIFTDKDYQELNPILRYKNSPQINSIKIFNLNIEKDKNIYEASSGELKNYRNKKIPELGLSSGPNEMFFRSCEIISKSHYKNFLILESDCFFVKNNWFKEIDKISNDKDFLIIGSKYKGQKIPYKNGFYKDYLNGVAIYKNSKDLHSILKNSRLYIKYAVKKKSFNSKLNYDTAISHYLKTLMPDVYKKKLKHTDLIINCSLRSDSKYGVKFFQDSNPLASIIHIKDYQKLKFNKTITVFLPCTRHEYISGKLKETINSYFYKVTPSITYSFNVVFLFNNIKSGGRNLDFKDILNLNEHPHVNSVIVRSLDLKRSEDIFCRPWDPNFIMPKKVPSLGLSSGPNESFFNSISFLRNKFKESEKFFLIEEDSLPIQNTWFDKMVDVCDSKSFIIAGSKYKGENQYHKQSFYKDHINGIAFYSNTQSLNNVLKICKKYLINKFSKKSSDPMDFFMHYDIAINSSLSENLNKYKYYKSNLLDIDEICNLSDPKDLSTKLKTIYRRFPKAVILHKKKVSDKEIYKEIYKGSLDI